MQLIHKSYKALIVAVLGVFIMGLFFQSCEKKEDVFKLEASGPSGVVVRGGEAFLIGTKLDEIVKVTLPDGSTYGPSGENSFLSSSPEKITLKVSENYPLGIKDFIYFQLSNGEIGHTKTMFTVFSEIQVNSIEPDGEGNPLKPGEEITINGVNLKEVLAVIFKDGTIVEAPFVSQADDAIKLVLPQEVSGGTVSVLTYDADGNPAQITEGPEITVIDPVLSKINGESNVAVKPLSEITLSGEYFGGIDIVNEVVNISFTGNKETLTVDGILDEVANTITFTLPKEVKAGVETAVIVKANGGNTVTSTAKFTIEKTRVTGYVNAEWNSSGTITLIGENLYREILPEIRFVSGSTENGYPVNAKEVSENFTRLTFDFPRFAPNVNPIIDNDRKYLRLPLVNGDTIHYCCFDFNGSAGELTETVLSE